MDEALAKNLHDLEGFYFLMKQAKALLYYQQHSFSSADDFEAFAESV